MLYLVSKINFEEDISKLIPSSEGSKELHKVLKSTTFSDKEVSYLEICPYLCSVGLGFLYHSLIIVFMVSLFILKLASLPDILFKKFLNKFFISLKLFTMRFS